MKRRRFVLILEALPDGVDARQLRWVLKSLLRRHGFKCVGLREQHIERAEDGGGPP
jgi:hypothetical protein